MASVRTVGGASHSDQALTDLKANYEAADRYDRLRIGQGITIGKGEAAECAAQIVEKMPLIGRRQRTADQIRKDCS